MAEEFQGLFADAAGASGLSSWRRNIGPLSAA